jgi:DNA polymerase I-like protein with 3'-5' exonuclease and polymerase domains
MTVHDSILFDVKKRDVYNTVVEIRKILNDTSEIFNRWFGTNLEVKLSTGCSVGPNWGNLKEI